MKSNKQRGNILTGMLVGIVVSIIVLGGAYWFFNNQKPKYSNLEKNQQFAKESSSLESNQTETLTPESNNPTIEFRPSERIPGRTDETITNIINEPSTQGAGESTLEPEQAQTQETPTRPEKIADKPADKPKQVVSKDSKIKPVAKRSFLQAGAFKNEQQADEQKAKLALLGIQSEIQQVDLGGGKGVFHRVRVGPFTNEDQLKKAQQTLSSNKIQADVVSPN